MPQSRKAARNRNVQPVTDSARMYKSLQVSCTRDEWADLREKFRIRPDVEVDWKKSPPEIKHYRGEYIILERQDTGSNPVGVRVDGIVFNIDQYDKISLRHVRRGQFLMELETLVVEAVEDLQDQEFQTFADYIDAHIQNCLEAPDPEWFDGVPLVFCMYVKLKVELFETQLPKDAPIAYCYAGPKVMRNFHETIPDYVPDDRFMDLNNKACCWVAKTSFWRGGVQTAEYEVGNDHCFLPGETVYFRSNAPRFTTPVWVVSHFEAEAFERLNEPHLVKNTLKQGDRFMLMKAKTYNDCEYLPRENEELPIDVLDVDIAPQTAAAFALDTRKIFALKTEPRGCYVVRTKTNSLTLGPPRGALKDSAVRFRVRSTQRTDADGNEVFSFLRDGCLMTVITDVSDGAVFGSMKMEPVKAGSNILRADTPPAENDHELNVQEKHMFAMVVDPENEDRMSLISLSTGKYVKFNNVELVADGETAETALHFTMERYVDVKVSQWDCSCLTVEVNKPAIIGSPIGMEEIQGIPWPEEHPLSFPQTPDVGLSVEYYMNLRGRLKFNALGLLHGSPNQQDMVQWRVECPLQRTSVMTPTSRLLYLDRLRMRDDAEQKAFRNIAEAIADVTFVKPVRKEPPVEAMQPMQHWQPAEYQPPEIKVPATPPQQVRALAAGHGGGSGERHQQRSASPWAEGGSSTVWQDGGMGNGQDPNQRNGGQWAPQGYPGQPSWRGGQEMQQWQAMPPPRQAVPQQMPPNLAGVPMMPQMAGMMPPMGWWPMPQQVAPPMSGSPMSGSPMSGGAPPQHGRPPQMPVPMHHNQMHNMPGIHPMYMQSLQANDVYRGM